MDTLLGEMAYPGGTRVLLCWLEQDAARLLSMCGQAGVPVGDLAGLPPKRQREQAAERLLLWRALGQHVTLGHTSQRAPFVQGMDVNISITHTMGLVALALNDRHVIGLDAESIGRPQLLRLRDKFLNSSEQQFIPPDDLMAHVIAWTVKEAVIKAERNSAINWTQDIRVAPFEYNSQGGIITASYGANRYRLEARRLRDHFLTLAQPAVP